MVNKKLINQIKTEIRFLQSEAMKDLVREADIGTCHEDCVTIERRKKKLKNLLKKSHKRMPP